MKGKTAITRQAVWSLAVLAVLMLCTVGAAAAQGSGTAPAPSRPSLLELETRVALSGQVPHASPVILAGSERLTITGRFRDELGRLQGMPLRLVGWKRATASKTPGTLDVIGYAPSGGTWRQPATLVGQLVYDTRGWYLVDTGMAHAYQLLGQAPAGLTEAAGAKVAISGKASRGVSVPLGIVVQSLRLVAPLGAHPVGER